MRTSVPAARRQELAEMVDGCPEERRVSKGLPAPRMQVAVSLWTDPDAGSGRQFEGCTDQAGKGGK